ncbi:hypothetical protein MNEG_10034, partial [Monoraphidium neglectum]
MLFVASCVAQFNATAPGAAQPGAANETLVSVDQPIPSFFAIRSCVPFSILVLPSKAPPAGAPGSPGANASAAGAARVLFNASGDVINGTNATVADGVLAIQLAHGFETHLPIQLIVYTDPARPLSYAAAYGSGDVVVGPGAANGSAFEAAGGGGGGRVIATGVDVQRVVITSSGTSGHHVHGSFDTARVRASGIGVTGLNSSRPAQVAARLGGITTLVADVPDGSSINGTADGLSKVVYADGQCNVQSATPLFRFPSIFGSAPMGAGAGGGGGLFDTNKCTKVAPEAIGARAPLPATTWTCGIIVDGQTFCT